MGIFDRLTGGGITELSPQGGLLLAAISMIAIDGDVDDDELAIVHRLNGSGRTKDWDDAFKAWKTKSTDECVRLAADSMSAEHHRTAMANLIDIAMADGVLAGREKVLLEQFTAAFDVNATEIERMVEMISVKNNKAIFE